MAGTSPAKYRSNDPDPLLFRLIRQAKTREPLLEPGQATAAIDQLLCTAGPRRMRLRVDVEPHGVARLAPGRTRQELGAVGHHDLDRVIAGVNFGFHGLTLSALPNGAAPSLPLPRMRGRGREGAKGKPAL